MNETPKVRTAPGPSFSFEANTSKPPTFSAITGQQATYSACPPFSAIRHLLSGKPLRGVKRPTK